MLFSQREKGILMWRRRSLGLPDRQGGSKLVAFRRWLWLHPWERWFEIQLSLPVWEQRARLQVLSQGAASHKDTAASPYKHCLQAIPSAYQTYPDFNITLSRDQTKHRLILWLVLSGRLGESPHLSWFDVSFRWQFISSFRFERCSVERFDKRLGILASSTPCGSVREANQGAVPLCLLFRGFGTFAICECDRDF